MAGNLSKLSGLTGGRNIMFNHLLRYVFHLGYLPDDGPYRPMLGGKLNARQWLWDLYSWALVTAGIFVRQGLDIPTMSWKLEHFTCGTLVASAMVALATFHWFMKWLNKQRAKPGFEHLAVSFAFGFFLNLAAWSAFKITSTGFSTG
jgi:hypothetical protein